MKPEDLEEINGELFRGLDVEDQNFVIGQVSKSQTYQSTYTPTGVEVVIDYVYDFS